MGIKKIILLIFIIILALSGYIFLKNKYNPLGVEMYFRGDLTNEVFLEIADIYNIKAYTIQYETIYQKNRLIMTSGMDTQLRDMPLVYGSFIPDINRKTAVIGDKIADKYFRTEDAVGNYISVLGQLYEIVGVIRDNNEIYIPFNGELLSYDWQKKMIIFEIPDSNALYLIAERINTELEVLGIEVYDTVVYNEKMNGYLNIAILVLVYILSYFAVRVWKKVRNCIASLYLGYRKVYRNTEWNRYVIDNRLTILKGLGQLTGLVLISIAIFKVFTSLTLPPSMLPDNFFSINSYLFVIKYKYQQLLMHLENGFSSIAVDVIILNLFFVLITLVTLIGLKLSRKA